jgi:hypothetical protein
LKGPKHMERIFVEILPGELIDRITILRIKARCVAEGPARQAVEGELVSLLRCRQHLPSGDGLAALESELSEVNQRLWDLEDELRLLERLGRFETRFLEAARAVCRNNDRRAWLRREINRACGVSANEEKVYR